MATLGPRLRGKKLPICSPDQVPSHNPDPRAIPAGEVLDLWLRFQAGATLQELAEERGCKDACSIRNLFHSRGLSWECDSRVKVFQELVCCIADETKYTKREIRNILRVANRLMREWILSGRDVQLWGVGWIRTYRGKARVGRSPVTKKPMALPPGQRVRFRMSSELKKELEKRGTALELPDYEEKYGLKSKKGE